MHSCMLMRGARIVPCRLIRPRADKTKYFKSWLAIKSLLTSSASLRKILPTVPKTSFRSTSGLWRLLYWLTGMQWTIAGTTVTYSYSSVSKPHNRATNAPDDRLVCALVWPRYGCTRGKFIYTLVWSRLARDGHPKFVWDSVPFAIKVEWHNSPLFVLAVCLG